MCGTAGYSGYSNKLNKHNVDARRFWIVIGFVLVILVLRELVRISRQDSG